MASLKAFTRCNGEVVELTRCGYMPEHLAARDGFSSYEGQTRFVRVISGTGLKPTATNGFREVKGRHLRFDVLGGLCNCGKAHLADRAIRQIERPAFASNHKCDGRCMSARGPKCECSCGGKNH